MKFKEWFPHKEEEKTILLKMVCSKGSAAILAVNNDGNPISTLLVIDDRGVYFCRSISENIGLPLDENGSIKIHHNNNIKPKEQQ
jgi:hypothetical protein